jgi:ketosteroid isomerase-like protein
VTGQGWGEDAKVASLLAVLEALQRGDLAGLQRQVAPGVTLHAAGRSRLAGTSSGAGAVLAYAASTSVMFDVGTTKLESVEPHGDELTAVVTADFIGRGKHTPVRITHRYHFDANDRIDEIHVEAEAQEDFDRLVEGW